MNVVITGATGTIGINFVNYLINNINGKILIIARNKEKAKEILPDNKKIEIIESTLDKIDKIDDIKKEYDVFYHIAWEGTRGKDRDNVEMQMNNVNYTLNALKFAKSIGCKKFIGIGSQAEYGITEQKLSEKTPTNPITAYGISKLCVGKLCRILAKELQIDFIWVRILSVYGPYDYENSLIMESIKKMLIGETPKYTKAEQLWDYIYIEDVVRALYLISLHSKADAIYCIGSGTQKRLSEYICEIKNAINEKLSLKFGEIEYRDNEVMNLCADISNLTRDTGFIPLISFKEGISKTIEWYKEKYK